MDSKNIHTISNDLLNRAIRIHVVGCGGTGGHIVARLPQLSKSLVALGHPEGLDVTVWDPDVVSESNVVRQNFFNCDIHQRKASVMVNRLNIAHGLGWKDRPEFFTAEAMRNEQVDFIIGCVDSKQGRREIDRYVRNQTWRSVYWIDAGNEESSGQVIVGESPTSRRKTGGPRLPLVTELYPEIIDGEDDNKPSCSSRESIFKQGIATNPMAAVLAYAWLCEALRHGKIGYSGVFFNLAQGRCTPIPVSESAWDAIRPAPTPEQMPNAA